jgi:hypothetical protein
VRTVGTSDTPYQQKRIALLEAVNWVRTKPVG